MNTAVVIFIAFLFLVGVSGLVYFMPLEAIWIAVAILISIILFHFISRIVAGKRIRESQPSWLQNATSLLIIFLVIFILFTVFLSWNGTNFAVIVLLVSLLFTMLMNFLTVPLAIMHKIKQKKEEFSPSDFLPKVSIIVPAYNEEKVVARTIDALVETDYPYKEIIVVDDGSQDATYEVATRYINQGVKVIRRPNGGKFAALNTGLAFTTGEIVVTVDADSMIARAAIREIVKGFEDPQVAGVAGNLKVFNRNTWLTRLQALEYIGQIQLLRRAFEYFGSLTVAAGAFSAFRRTALDEVGRYDPDFLLEDFDITIKLLKAHAILHGNNEAVCYTEAPETLRDVYKQRLSWFRGDYQNFWKHRNTFFNPRFGILHKLTFPYMLMSMTLVPLASMVVIATSVIMIVYGEWMTLLFAFLLFLTLQTLQSILAILIAEDDMKLAIYSPFFVIGYKQFLDFIMIRALIDIILAGGVYRRRERVTRIGDAGAGKKPATKPPYLERGSKTAEKVSA